MSTAGLSSAEANNFQLLESRLVELVSEAVAGLLPAVHVLTSADLTGLDETRQKTPAVHVIYGGFRVVESRHKIWRLQHTWLVVVAVKTAAKVRSGEHARQNAGVLFERVVNAVAGASLPGTTKPLDLITPPAARYAAGHQYIPAAFAAETLFKNH